MLKRKFQILILCSFCAINLACANKSVKNDETIADVTLQHEKKQAKDYNLLLNKAIETFNLSNYKYANDSLSEIISDNPSADILVQAKYYSGMSKYKLAKYEDAINDLQFVIDANTQMFNNLTIKQALIDCNKRLGNWDITISLAQELILENSPYVKTMAHLYWAEGLLEIGLYSNFDLIIEKAKELQSQTTFNENELKEVRSQYYFILAKSKLVKLFSKNPTAKLDSSSEVEAGVSEYYKSRLSVIASSYEEIIEILKIGDPYWTSESVNLEKKYLNKLYNYAENFNDIPDSLEDEKKKDFVKGIRTIAKLEIQDTCKKISDLLLQIAPIDSEIEYIKNHRALLNSTNERFKKISE